MHVPNDVALSIRAPKYLDQIKLISKISKKINNDKILFIKEHPAKIGATNILKLIKILKKKNIKILHPKVNTFDIIKRADSVITINSKTGFETILFNKPLNVFGESYYKNLNKVNYLDDKKIQLEFYKVLNNKESNNFFWSLYKKSFQGELYFYSIRNIKNFVKCFKSLNVKYK